MFLLNSSIIAASYGSWARLCCKISGFLFIHLCVFLTAFNVIIVIFSSINNYYKCYIFFITGVTKKPKQNKNQKKEAKTKTSKQKKQQHFPKSKNRTQFCKFNNKSIIKELGTSESVSNISMPSAEDF